MNWDYYGGDVQIRRSIFRDILKLKDRLRSSDIQEIKSAQNQTPLQALQDGLEKSDICLTVLYKGLPVAMGGVTRTAANVGIVWLLGSNDINKIRVSFLRLSKIYMEKCLAEYGTLFNFIPPSNAATIRWLVWLGASLDDPKPIGVDGSMFQYFSIGKSLVEAA